MGGDKHDEASSNRSSCLPASSPLFVRRIDPLSTSARTSQRENMSGICLMRLQEERKQWRKDHPYVRLALPRREIETGSADPKGSGLQGFWARPQKLGEALNLLQWDVGVPGKDGVSLSVAGRGDGGARLDDC